MEIRFHPAAVDELEEALDHYAAIDGKLALDLLREWDLALGRISQALRHGKKCEVIAGGIY